MNTSQKRLKKVAEPEHWENRLASPPLKLLTPTKTYSKEQTTIFSPQIPTTSKQTFHGSPLLSPKSTEFINQIIDFPTPPKKIPAEQYCTIAVVDTPRKNKLKATIRLQKVLLKNKRSMISKYRKNITENRLKLNVNIF